jgi:hypothetical protein
MWPVPGRDTDYLTPRALPDLLERPDCGQVAVFTNMAKWIGRYAYLLFKRVRAQEDPGVADIPNTPI